MGFPWNGSLSDRPTVTQTFLDEPSLSDCRDTIRHLHTLAFFPQRGVTYPIRYTQVHTPTCSSVLSVDDSIGSSCDWGDWWWRQDGGCHHPWVTGCWGGGGGMWRDSWVQGMKSFPSDCLCVCLVFSLILYNPSMSCACQTFATFLSSSSCLLISVSLLVPNSHFPPPIPGWWVDGFCPLSITSNSTSRKKKNNGRLVNRVLENMHPIYGDNGGGVFLYVRVGVSHFDRYCKWGNIVQVLTDMAGLGPSAHNESGHHKSQ